MLSESQGNGFDELKRLLERYDFQWRNPCGSHYIFWHPLLPDVQLVLAKPHRTSYVKPVYVKRVVQLIDDVVDRMRQEGGAVEGEQGD